MNKMTDEEIIIALGLLEILVCDTDAQRQTVCDAIDLISHLKAEIERLEKESADKERAYTEEYILRKELKSQQNTIKAETIKEFVERLEEYKCVLLYENPHKPLIDYGESVTHFGVEAVCFNDIKTVEKEMVGESNG